MKKLLSFIICLSLVVSLVVWYFQLSTTHAAIARAQFKSGFVNNGTVINATFDSSTTSGNFIAVLVSCYYNAGNCATENNVAITDNKSNTYAKASFLSAPGNQWIFYAENISGGAAHTVTMTASGAGAVSYYIMTILEYSGIAISGSLDQTAVSGELNDDTSYTSGSVITTQADELLIGVHRIISTTITFTPTSPFGEVVRFADSLHEHEVQEAIVSSTGTYESNGTLSSSVISKSNSMATFKMAAAAPAARTSPDIKIKGGVKLRGGIKFR